MNTSNFEWPVDKKPLYSLLSIRLRGLIDGIPHQISNLANASALLGDALLNINWVGFYLMREGMRFRSCCRSPATGKIRRRGATRCFETAKGLHRRAGSRLRGLCEAVPFGATGVQLWCAPKDNLELQLPRSARHRYPGRMCTRIKPLC